MQIQLFTNNQIISLDTEVNSAEEFSSYNLNKSIYDALALQILEEQE